ncbi:uncharacterized protein si:zfos-1056e6.1 isoform X2 [Pristis pectinata]|uniref:uncharacterized protein si:zfos-1056e6.1 isoform X2 n=1 Tax=Pristis pectinata TaxID=685728 RepID=UPI00223D9B4D|nr:uncharacterized protein si:zfos-1056e6.1 isoform X2 [Pristis pectinata]
MAAVTNEAAASRIWIALKRLDLNDDEVTVVKDVWILQGLDTVAAKQVLFHSFGLEDGIFVLKLRNSQGSLIPINSELNINSKQSPYVLEVVKLFQHVVPKPRTAALTVINKGLKNRLQSIMKRIERLEELGPEIKMRWQDKLYEEMGLLNQKLHFLDQRMQQTEEESGQVLEIRRPRKCNEFKDTKLLANDKFSLKLISRLLIPTVGKVSCKGQCISDFRACALYLGSQEYVGDRMTLSTSVEHKKPASNLLPCCPP